MICTETIFELLLYCATRATKQDGEARIHLHSVESIGTTAGGFKNCEKAIHLPSNFSATPVETLCQQNRPEIAPQFAAKTSLDLKTLEHQMVIPKFRLPQFPTHAEEREDPLAVPHSIQKALQ